jgi:hypothetical protein
MYNKNEFCYTFFFSLTNDIDKFDNKHTYFAVKKSIEDVNEIGQDNHIPIVDKDTDIVIFTENDFKADDNHILRNYTEEMTFAGLIDRQKRP